MCNDHAISQRTCTLARYSMRAVGVDRDGYVHVQTRAKIIIMMIIMSLSGELESSTQIQLESSGVQVEPIAKAVHVHRAPCTWHGGQGLGPACRGLEAGGLSLRPPRLCALAS